LSADYLTPDQKRQLLDEDMKKGNELQIWRNRKKTKVCYSLEFNCIFGCKIPGPKDTEDLIKACKECHQSRIPNVIFKYTVSKDFPIDEINFFSSEESARNGFQLSQALVNKEAMHELNS